MVHRSFKCTESFPAGAGTSHRRRLYVKWIANAVSFPSFIRYWRCKLSWVVCVKEDRFHSEARVESFKSDKQPVHGDEHNPCRAPEFALVERHEDGKRQGTHHEQKRHVQFGCSCE